MEQKIIHADSDYAEISRWISENNANPLMLVCDGSLPFLPVKDYLDRLTPEKCTDWAFRWTEGIWVAKLGGRVIGFGCFGDRGEEAPGVGEIFALYVLPEYHGTGVAQALMQTGLEQLADYPTVCLWVLKENARAIRFYQKCGFRLDGTEEVSKNTGSVDVRMVRDMIKLQTEDSHVL